MPNSHLLQNVIVQPHSSMAAQVGFADKQDAYSVSVNSRSPMSMNNPDTAARLSNSGSTSGEHEQDTCTSSFTRNVDHPGRVTWPDACRHGWHWLTSLKKAILSFHAHRRKEREIRKAVAALSEFDDRTLRDLGIPSRSEIEQVVRYCRDC
jgi:uncharacterized protein YjiS (DUF1127 family)